MQDEGRNCNYSFRDVALADKVLGKIPENDWSKMRELDFQERYREKETLLGQLGTFQCVRCPDLDEHVSFVGKRVPEALADMETFAVWPRA